MDQEIQRQETKFKEKFQQFNAYRILESRKRQEEEEEERQRQPQPSKKKRTCIFTRGTVRGIQRKYGRINEQRDYVRDRITRCKNNEWTTRPAADVETEVSRIINEANRHLVKSDGVGSLVADTDSIDFYPAEKLLSNEYYFLVPKDTTPTFNVETQKFDPPPKVMKIKKLGSPQSTVKVDGIKLKVDILPEGSFFTYNGSLLCQSASISFNKLTMTTTTFETGQRCMYNVGSSSVTVTIDHFERKFLARDITETLCFVRGDNNKVFQTTWDKLTPLHTTTRTETPTRTRTPTRTKSILKKTTTPTFKKTRRNDSDAYKTYLEIAQYANQPSKLEKETAIQNVRDNLFLNDDRKQEIIARINTGVPLSDLDKEAAMNAANNESPHKKTLVDTIRRTMKKFIPRKRKHVEINQRINQIIKPGTYYGGGTC
jgi:hypothetical protein